jgi:histidinol dehydrogenase
MGSRVAEAVERQLAALPRAETARVALSASRIIVARDLAQCVAISNQYGPEHLIIQTRQARELVDSITSAGSVFLGDWSPESAGDYASGQPRPADLWLPPPARASAWPTSRNG